MFERLLGPETQSFQGLLIQSSAQFGGSARLHLTSVVESMADVAISR
jgi:hypothetical protein